MKKRAFTLVELIISVILLGLIVNFLYTSVSNLQKSNILLANLSKESQKKEQIINLLYSDILLATDINITGRKNSTLKLQTKNSIFDIEYPYVAWLISKDNMTLLRVESIKKLDDKSVENRDLYHISVVKEGCERFMIYNSKDKKNILVHIKFKDEEPILFEFYKPK